MSIGNIKTSGDQGSNHLWQLAMLKQLKVIETVVIAGGGASGGTNQLIGPALATGAGSIPAAAKAFVIDNIGSADGVVNGGPLPDLTGVSVSADPGKTFSAPIAYDATGTTFLISYIL
jgi:hypothetical protein